MNEKIPVEMNEEIIDKNKYTMKLRPETAQERRERLERELFLDEELKRAKLLFYRAGIEMFKEMTKHLKQMEKDNG